MPERRRQRLPSLPTATALLRRRDSAAAAATAPPHPPWLSSGTAPPSPTAAWVAGIPPAHVARSAGTPARAPSAGTVEQRRARVLPSRTAGLLREAAVRTSNAAPGQPDSNARPRWATWHTTRGRKGGEHGEEVTAGGVEQRRHRHRRRGRRRGKEGRMCGTGIRF
ncbi:hypothetical protein PVAP13_9NG304819 [Panicum virgatum]|uniref:Uncharacterized protein n=1 Tax=Panicum virgatum TaxID=38727 RepID=A0A8T0MLB7_PANVG|nr:hypothetical protein PVAP13_9NG304819 [Panicum virgatum]